MCWPMQYSNQILAHNMMLALRNASGLMIFCGRMRVSTSLQILTSLFSGCRASLDTSVNMTLPQSVTFQIICCWHLTSRAPLASTDRWTQIRGIRSYSPLICILRKRGTKSTKSANIILPMNYETMRRRCNEGRSSVHIAYNSNISIIHGGNFWTSYHMTTAG